MFLRLHFGPDLFDFSFRTNEERHPMRSHVLAAHETFLTPHAVSLHDFLVLIRQQSKWQPVLFDEFRMGFDRINAHAEDHSAFGFESSELIAKGAGFLRAA